MVVDMPEPMTEAAGARTAGPRPTAADSVKSNSSWPWLEPLPYFGGDLPAGLAWPKISVVTPSYNHASIVERTMRSVLTQGYPNLEYVVIDDGSSDNSADVIRHYEPKLTHWEQHANRGQYGTVNKAFSFTGGAGGDVMAWLNSDDMYLPWTLWWVGRIFATYPPIDWITGSPLWFQDGTVHRVGKRTPFPRDLIRAGLFYGGPGGLGWIQQESMFWRRSLWEKAGGKLREDLRLAADYELIVRFAEHADLWVTSTLLGGYGFRGGNLNRSIVGRDKYLAEIAQVRKELSAKGQGLKALDLYDKVKRLPVVRGVARRALRLGRYRGPVLNWDFEKSEYRLESEPFFGR